MDFLFPQLFQKCYNSSSSHLIFVAGQRNVTGSLTPTPRLLRVQELPSSWESQQDLFATYASNNVDRINLSRLSSGAEEREREKTEIEFPHLQDLVMEGILPPLED
jgi:hypothetical protein